MQDNDIYRCYLVAMTQVINKLTKSKYTDANQLISNKCKLHFHGNA